MSDLSAFFMNQAEASAHVHFIYDVAQARIIYLNPAYEQTLHNSREQIGQDLPKRLARLHPDDRAYMAHYWKLWVRGQMADEVELRLLTPGEPERWFCLTPYWQPEPDGSVRVAGTLRDISVAKRYQRNSDNYNTRKNATLEILSHDLSNTFVLVQQIAAYLREEVPMPAESRASELLRVLETSSQESVQMIRDLVNLEFLASVNTDLKRDRVEISAALSPPLEELQRREQLLGHHFEVTLPPEPVYVQLDVNKFTQVLTNLVGNAIKFTPDGGRITVQIEPCPDCVHIHVADTGVGIPEALKPHLFERFTKARRPGLRGEPTIGLGMALCQTIVEWHQGTMRVTSAEGQGTTVTVELPRATV